MGRAHGLRRVDSGRRARSRRARPWMLLAVADPQASARWYADLLGREAAEVSPGFALFITGGGMRLGLWRRDAMQPKVPPAAAPGAAEVCFELTDPAELDALHARWVADGLPVAQVPTDMDFGRTCVVLDPDGHRVRAFVPV